jgi:hypothetical protein
MNLIKLFFIFTLFSSISFLTIDETNISMYSGCPPKCDIVGADISGFCRASGEGTRCYRDPLFPDEIPKCNGTYVPLSCS